MRLRRSSFDTTRWSLIAKATGEFSEDARAALATLCESYWYPLYSFVRRYGHDPETARDLTQAFFARLLEKDDLEDACRERGRFRCFLLASLKHFLSNERQYRRAHKRGGHITLQSLDADLAEGHYARELADAGTPEALFDRAWACAVLDRVLGRLRTEWVDAGKTAEFEQLRPCLTGESHDGGYLALGVELGLSEGAVKVTVHRMRRRYRDLLRQEIADTVLTDESIDDEIRYLIRVLSTR